MIVPEGEGMAEETAWPGPLAAVREARVREDLVVVAILVVEVVAAALAKRVVASFDASKEMTEHESGPRPRVVGSGDVEATERGARRCECAAALGRGAAMLHRRGGAELVANGAVCEYSVARDRLE